MERLAVHAVHAVGAVWASMLPRVVTDVWWTRGEIEPTYAFLRMADWSYAAPRLAWYGAIDPQVRRSQKATRDAITRSVAVVATDGATALEQVIVMVPERGPRQLEATLRALAGTRDEEAWRRVLRPEGSPPDLEALEALFKKSFREPSALVMAAAAGRSPDAPALIAKAHESRSGLSSDGTALALTLAAHRCGQLGVSDHLLGRHISLAQRSSAQGQEHPWLASTFGDDLGEQISAVTAGASVSEAQASALREKLATSHEQREEGLISDNELAEREYASALGEGAAAVDALLARDMARALEEARSFAATIDVPGARTPTQTFLDLDGQLERGSPVTPRKIERHLKALQTAVSGSSLNDPLTEAGYELGALMKLLTRAGSQGNLEPIAPAVAQIEKLFGPLDQVRTWRGPLPLAVELLTFCPKRSRALAGALGLEEYERVEGELALRRRARLLAGLWRDGEVEMASELMEPVMSAPPGSLPWTLVAEMVQAAAVSLPALVARVKQAASDAVAQLSGPAPLEAWRPATVASVEAPPAPADPEPTPDAQTPHQRAEAIVLKAAQAVLGDDRVLEARFNEESGQVELFLYMTVVEEVTRPRSELTLADLERHNLSGASVGEELGFQLFWRKQDRPQAQQQERDFGELMRLTYALSDLGRIGARVARQSPPAKRRASR